MGLLIVPAVSGLHGSMDFFGRLEHRFDVAADMAGAREWCPELPQERADILSRTLSKFPSQRYQTGAEIAADPRLIRAVLPALTQFGVAPRRMSDPDRPANESAMLATVVTPASISSHLLATASFDIRL